MSKTNKDFFCGEIALPLSFGVCGVLLKRERVLTADATTTDVSSTDCKIREAEENVKTVS